MRNKISNLKKMVLEVMKKVPNTRNSDVSLTLHIWDKFYPDRIHSINGRKFVYLSDISELPREDNVKRIRAKIQNEEGKLLPTKRSVVIKRRINEEVWLEAMRRENL